MAASREYVAKFKIGAVLLGSFRGAMAAAQSRLRRLQSTARSVGKSFLKFGTMFTGLFAGVAAFGVGALFRKLFEGADEAAAAAEQRTRKLTAALMTQNKIRAQGRAHAEAQVKEIMQATQLMSQQGVFAKGMYDSAAGILALQKIGPQEIVKALPALADVLVASQGINASMEDMNALALAFGKGVQTGTVPRSMMRYIGSLTIAEAKELKLKAKQGDRLGAFNFLMQRMMKFSGETAKALKTPEGRIQALDNAIGVMRKHLGEATVESRAKFADAWRRMLPKIEPILIKLVKGIAKMFEKLADYIETTLMPVFERLNAFWDTHPELQQGILDLIKNIGLAGAAVTAFGLIAAVNPMLWVAIAAAAVLLLANNWDTAARSASEYVRQQEAMGKGDTGLTKMVKLLDDLMTGFDLIGVAIDFYMIDPLNKVAEKLNKISDAWRNIPGLGWTAPSRIPIEPHVQIPGARERLEAKQRPVILPPKPPVESTMLPIGVDVYRQGAKKIIMPMQDLKAATEAVSTTTAAATPKVDNFVTQLKDVSTTAPQATTELGYLLGALRMIGGIVAPSIIPGAAARGSGASYVAPGAAAANGVDIPPADMSQNVPGYASGGIVNRPTLATVGERGPEAIIPLRKGGGGTTHVNFAPVITIHGNATAAEQASLDAKLRDLARDFVANFKRAQVHERRLSYEGGYG
jgi:hypothetical protein